MRLLQSSLRVFLLIGMAFWLTGCLPVEEEEDAGGALPTTWYKDADGDTYGDPAIEVDGVDDPSAPGDLWVADNTDCDDANAMANPSELETADRVDNDCDGEVDNGFKYAFATSIEYPGNLGAGYPSGLEGADAICQNSADAAVPALPTGTYTAWLSSSPTIPPSLTTDARDRVTDDQSNTFTYVNTGGMVIAAGFTQLTGGNIVNPIKFDESGLDVGGSDNVWTGSDVDGRNNSVFFGPLLTCNNWMSDDNVMGHVGSTNTTSSSWTLSNALDCEQFKRLYCIQK